MRDTKGAFLLVAALITSSPSLRAQAGSCDEALLESWATDTLAGFVDDKLVIHAPQFGESEYLFWTSQGYLYGWLYHETRHACVSFADNSAGGADPNSCLHLAIDNASHGEACSKAAAIKGNSCDESEGSEGEGEGDGPREPDGEGEEESDGTDGAAEGEQDGGDEPAGDEPPDDLTPEESKELEGLCDFMQEMEEKWSNDAASDCISSSPLSSSAAGCGLAYPPAPEPGEDGSASAIGGCGCC